ncbi:MAG: CvpA family protein [Natronospirillum sp.]
MIMATVDIVILVIIVLSCMMGGFRGLVKEALSLTAWVAALLIATLFYEQMGNLMAGLIENSSLRNVAAFSLLFVLTIFIGTLISNLVSKLISAVGLGGADRLLGTLFGIIRGLIIVGLVVLLSYPFEFARQWFEGSILVPWIVVLIEQFQQILGSGNSDAFN